LRVEIAEVTNTPVCGTNAAKSSWKDVT